MSSSANVTYQPGMVVPWHFMPGIIVASFFASLTGTLLTVELLHRKRLGKTIVSRLQLLACAVAMGLVGIWCMHFIGNRSIILGNGEDWLQMSYSPGFTFLSCVLPTVGLSFAFYIAEMRIDNIYLRRTLDVTSGVLAGLSIVGMHYCGNLGTSNYKLIYPPRFIIAACIIAVGDCIIALMLFFYFKEKWISVFWKRLGCAVILAVAVCGMHYTASVGCTYQLKSISDQNANRNTAVIVAGVLCCVAALSVLSTIIYANKRNKKLAERAQQVMVACAYFDQDDNIMVTNEGLLPSQMIAKRFTLQKFDDEFNTGHPVFHWIWKVSNDWDAVSDLIGKMRRHLRRIDPTTSQPGSSAASVEPVFDDESYEDVTAQFRMGFCVASADLADRLHVRLDQVGVLFDRVTGTGVLPSYAMKKIQADQVSIASSMFLEKGQLLFFTRRLGKEDTDRFEADGYRFAPPSRVEAMIARTMQIPHIGVAAQVKRLQDYAVETSGPPPVKQGTYLACFAALGRVRGHFDLLVAKSHQDQLPDIQLLPNHLTTGQVNFLRQYNGCSAGKMVRDLRDKDARNLVKSEQEREFAVLMINALSTLAYELSEEWFSDLTFNAKPIVTSYGRSKEANTVMIFGLTRLLDIHQGLVKQPDRLTFVPLDFFRVRASFYPGCGDRSKLRHTVHNEFAALLQESYLESHDDKIPGGGGRAKFPQFLKRSQSSGTHDSDSNSIVKGDNSSERGLVHDPDDMLYDTAGVPSSKRLWGGILATTDTVIVNTTVSSGGIGNLNAMEMKEMIPRVTATAIGVQDEKTFADILYEDAKAQGSARPGGHLSPRMT